MSVADIMEAMSKAGAPIEAILIAVRAIEAKDAEIEARRANDRERKRRQRGTVTGQSRDTDVTVTDTPPVLDKETSPTPPKEINPTPRVGIALARKAAGFGPPEGIEIGLWNEFCGQRKKPLTSTAYQAILNKLAEAAEAGWPPGELFTRALEGGWETIFVPKEPRNGRSGSDSLGGGSGQRGANRQDGFLSAIRQAADSFGPNDCGGMPRAAGMG